jgi:glyoxylase-like metal-dependent hydrolase (beta-lactamase superfamily II)
MKFGQFEIHTFVEQEFRLDGGSIFGVIPKVIWEKLIPADENNLLPMVNNLFVLKANGQHFLFDTGLGDALTAREKKIYNAPGKTHIETGLSKLGLAPEDIDGVILTHLHTDHAGGAIKSTRDGFEPRFPKAVHYVSEAEWDVAMAPDERTSAAYAPKRLRALKDAESLELLTGDTEIQPGIKAIFTGGHTSGHFALEITSEEQSVFYYADIFCTTAHLKVPYVPGADLFPMETMKIKRHTLPRIVDHDVVLAFDHDVHTPLARIRQEDGRLFAESVDGDVE